MTEIKTALPRCPRTGKPIFEIFHSGLNTFGSCPRKWAFNKAIVNFSEDREAKTAADVGTAIHEGLQEYVISKDVDAALAKMALAHPIELNRGDNAAAYSLEAATITLLHAIESGELDNFVLATFIKDGVRIPAVEIGFMVEIEMEHIIIHLRGFIDLVVQSRASDQFMAIDIKTTTERGAESFDVKYKFDWQTTSYGIPLQGLLGIEGSFDTGILGVGLSDRDPLVVFKPFRRKKADVEEYYYYLLDKCASIQRYWLAQRFPRDPKACLSFNKTCYFFNSCDVSTVTEMQMLVNPSMKRGKSGREVVPVFTARLEYNG